MSEGPNEDGRYTRTVYRVSVLVHTVHQQDLPQGGWEDTDVDDVPYEEVIGESESYPTAIVVASNTLHSGRDQHRSMEGFELS